MLLRFLIIFLWTDHLWAAEKSFIRRRTPPPGKTTASALAAINNNTLMVGGGYAVRVIPEGFIPALNESINVEFLGFMGKNDNFHKDGSTLGLTAGARWDFHLSRNWTVFAQPEVTIRSDSDKGDRLQVGLTGGAFFRWQETIYLRGQYSETIGAYVIGAAFLLD